MWLYKIRQRLKQFLWRRSYLFKRRFEPLDSLWEKRHLERFLTDYKIDCVFDVGANKGQYGLMLRREIGYRGLIISFEPNPEAHRTLLTSTEQDPEWIAQKIALSDENGHALFNIMSADQFSSLHDPRHEEIDAYRESNKVERQVKVPTETLEDAYGRLKSQYGFERPFLKMDTQGHDVTIAAHAGEVLQEFLGIQSELSIKGLYEGSPDFREALSAYEDMGFELSALVPNNAGMFPLLVEVDCIMIRSDLAETALGE